MKDVIVSICVVLILIVLTVCGSYYLVTKYNIDKENDKILSGDKIILVK